ncbi:hypothetical protein P3T36_007516 [Kitasatospora sp. MAP12-15]|uniref:hypothetical protein n=1 Tax=unclassified Kitasatospora TaxID=2633591 RepID=UPI00247E626A|nr:hypothetical protein [Kitasatospora sp. MAP12-44]
MTHATADQPFSLRDARAELRRLGRAADRQARSGASEEELDVTLRAMRAVHERIAAGSSSSSGPAC